MSTIKPRSGATLAAQVTLIAILTAVLAFSGAKSLNRGNSFARMGTAAGENWFGASRGNHQVEPSGDDLRSMLYGLGLDADTLAAAGVDARGVVAALDAADAWFGEFGVSALQSRDAVSMLKARCSEVRRSLRRGESAHSPADLTAAAESLGAAQSTWSQHLASLWTCVSPTFGEQAATQIQSMNGAAEWAVSIPARTSSRPEAQWLALERAESFESPSEVLPEDAALARQVESELGYITARSNWAVYSPDNRSAWVTRWGEQ